MSTTERNEGRRLINREDGVVIEFVPFPSQATPKGDARYRDPANPLNTWSGRGQRPSWLAAYVEKGRSVEEFAIPGAPPRVMTSRYRDPADPGNTWTGYGRRPTWLLTYLDAGRSLEEFEVKNETI
ncbi:hypothetical protein PTKU64_94140 (plasmid) [Paraburkholderia terrae]|uniref:DNA-binding protein H-NS-like C-terminal domain-containing protein n=1 Tax=Paraburkholderia terrae TaxID=311230 RepID=A0ABN6K0K6_9BURK|nr:hypothetical protein PTKU64_94140 [Paraburkholderia terrae]